MKKLTALILSMVMVFGLAACGASESSTQTSEPASSTETANAETTAPAESTAAETEEQPEGASESEVSGGKTLVVYYSGSGHTREVAETVADETGGDLFEIVPEEVYTDDDLDYTNPDSRVCREYEDESLRDVPLTETTVENWDEYDTIYIGYPIWWGIAAWPVNSFVESNDFTGKTVIPFCTSASSGLGESGTLLAEMAGTGDWQEGQRFQSSASEDDVREWVNSLE